LKHWTGRHKACEIWESQGRTGSPDDHWFEAERALRAEEEPTATARDRFDATVERAPPVAAVGAFFDRLLGQSEFCCDLLVASPLPEQDEYLPLPLG
jgi:hypothetical protein